MSQLTGRRAAALILAVSVAAITLVGCVMMPGGRGGPGDDDDPARRESDVARADVMFSAMMIPHHEEAVEMSRLLLEKDGIDATVDDLARRIDAAQAPEIDQMEGWLDDWGYGGMSDMPGMGSGDGMMSGSDLDELEAAEGDDAERLFLTEMIDHHQTAIDMAESEVRNGRHDGVLDLARDIIRSQTAEIVEMRGMLRHR